MLIKPAYNEEFRLFDFAPQLTDGESLTGQPTVTVIREDTGEDVSATMVSQVAVYNLTAVRYRLAGGVAGRSYQRIFRAATSNGQLLEDAASLRVK